MDSTNSRQHKKGKVSMSPFAQDFTVLAVPRITENGHLSSPSMNLSSPLPSDIASYSTLEGSYVCNEIQKLESCIFIHAKIIFRVALCCAVCVRV